MKKILLVLGFIAFCLSVNAQSKPNSKMTFNLFDVGDTYYENNNSDVGNLFTSFKFEGFTGDDKKGSVIILVSWEQMSESDGNDKKTEKELEDAARIVALKAAELKRRQDFELKYGAL